MKIIFLKKCPIQNYNNLGDDFKKYHRKLLFWGLKKRLKLLL